MTKKYIQIADLIYREKLGFATEEEKRELAGWLDESEANRQVYAELLRRSVSSESYEEYRAVHRAAVWQRLERQIGPRRRGISWRWVGYAASVAVLVVAGWWLYTRDGMSGDVVEGTRVATVSPGSRKAILHLDSGERVVLADTSGVIVDDRVLGRIEQTGDALVYAAEAGASVERFNVLEIPRGGEFRVTLADGTRVWLNAGTRLRYPVAFVGGERRVALDGEAYFEVTRDTLHPFIVEAGGQVLTVLGTAFGVRAYEDEKAVLTTLERGRVNVASGGRDVELTPGLQSRLADGQFAVRRVNTRLYTAWHVGVFVFSDQSLGEILGTLSRWYDIEVVYEARELEDIRFTGELRRYSDIREFLDRIQELRKVRFDIQDGTVTVSRY